MGVVHELDGTLTVPVGVTILARIGGLHADVDSKQHLLQRLAGELFGYEAYAALAGRPLLRQRGRNDSRFFRRCLGHFGVPPEKQSSVDRANESSLWTVAAG